MDLYDEYGWVDNCLYDNERVLWRGKPEEGHLLGQADVFAIPFSICWFGFAIVWETLAVTGGAPFFFCLFGVPFIIVGLYITVGRFFVRKGRMNSTRYAITDKRVIRCVKGKVDFIDYSNGVKIHTKMNSDGTGTITFGENPSFNQWGGNAGFWEMAGNNVFAMENISDVNEAYRLIEENGRK